MRHLNKDLWLLYASNFLFAVGMGLYASLWPAYVRQLGGTPVNIGLLAGIGGVAGLVFAVPAGLIADRFERRAQILLGWAMAIPVPIMFALAGNWRALVPGQVLLAAGIVFFPAMQAYIMEKAPAGSETFVYTFLMSSFPLGSVIGPPIGGWLADRSGIPAVFWAVAVVWVLATLASVPLSAQRPRRAEAAAQGERTRGGGERPPRSRVHARAASRSARKLWDSLFYVNSRVLWLAALFVAVFGLQSVAATFITPFLQDVAKIDLFWISVLAAAASLGAAFGSPILGWLADRHGKLRVLGGAQIVVMSGFLGLLLVGPLVGRAGLTSSPFLLLLGASLIRGIGGMSVAFAAAGGMVPTDKRGRVFAFIHLANGLGLTFGPYAGGYLYERNPMLPFLMAAGGLSVIGVALVFRRGRRPGGLRPRRAPAPAACSGSGRRPAPR